MPVIDTTKEIRETMERFLFDKAKLDNLEIDISEMKDYNTDEKNIAIKEYEARKLKRHLERVINALNSLTPQVYDLVKARYIDGLSCGVIGSQIGISQITVNKRIRAGLKQLDKLVLQRDK